MVSPKDWLANIGGRGELHSDLDAIRTKHGRAAAGYLARLTGVKTDTARRWLKGSQQPSTAVAGRISAIQGAGQHIRNANRVRNMTKIRPRMVAVDSDSPKGGSQGDGYRQIDQDIALGVMSDRIADAIESGDYDQASDLLSQAMIAGYAGEDVTDDSGLASLLHVTDFQVDPHATYEGEWE